MSEDEREELILKLWMEFNSLVRTTSNEQKFAFIAGARSAIITMEERDRPTTTTPLGGAGDPATYPKGLSMADRTYPDDAIERAKIEAAEWLEGNADGYPRSRHQEKLNTERRGYDVYDEIEAPPITGYEALEREGRATRMETVNHGGQERIHFRAAAEPSPTDP